MTKFLEPSLKSLIRPPRWSIFCSKVSPRPKKPRRKLPPTRRFKRLRKKLKQK